MAWTGLVRRYGYLLNRNIILHPTVAERRDVAQRALDDADRGWALRNELSDSWKDLLHETAPEQRDEVGDARLTSYRRARDRGWLQPPDETRKPAIEMRPEITADALLFRMSSATPRTTGDRVTEVTSSNDPRAPFARFPAGAHSMAADHSTLRASAFAHHDGRRCDCGRGPFKRRANLAANAIERYGSPICMAR